MMKLETLRDSCQTRGRYDENFFLRWKYIQLSTINLPV